MERGRRCLVVHARPPGQQPSYLMRNLLDLGH